MKPPRSLVDFVHIECVKWKSNHSAETHGNRNSIYAHLSNNWCGKTNHYIKHLNTEWNSLKKMNVEKIHSGRATIYQTNDSSQQLTQHLIHRNNSYFLLQFHRVRASISIHSFSVTLSYINQANARWNSIHAVPAHTTTTTAAAATATAIVSQTRSTCSSHFDLCAWV